MVECCQTTMGYQNASSWNTSTHFSLWNPWNVLRVSYCSCWLILLAIASHAPSSYCHGLKLSYKTWKFKKLSFSYRSLYFCKPCLSSFIVFLFENLSPMLLIFWLYQNSPWATSHDILEVNMSLQGEDLSRLVQSYSISLSLFGFDTFG